MPGNYCAEITHSACFVLCISFSLCRGMYRDQDNPTPIIWWQTQLSLTIDEYSDIPVPRKPVEVYYDKESHQSEMRAYFRYYFDRSADKHTMLCPMCNAKLASLRLPNLLWIFKNHLNIIAHNNVPENIKDELSKKFRNIY